MPKGKNGWPKRLRHLSDLNYKTSEIPPDVMGKIYIYFSFHSYEPKSFGGFSFKPTAASCLFFFLYILHFRSMGQEDAPELCMLCNYLCCKTLLYPKGLTLPTQLCFHSNGPEDRLSYVHLSISIVYGWGDSLLSLTCNTSLMYISNHFVWDTWQHFLFEANKD